MYHISIDHVFEQIKIAKDKLGFLGGTSGKEPLANAGNASSIPG